MSGKLIYEYEGVQYERAEVSDKLEGWRCVPCSSVSVKDFGEGDSIFSGWTVLDNGCGCGHGGLNKDEAFFFANRRARALLEQRVQDARIDLDDLEESLGKVVHISLPEADS